MQEGIFFLIHLLARDVLVLKILNIKKIVVGKLKKKFQKKFLLIKKLEIEKTKPTFIISVLKVEY